MTTDHNPEGLPAPCGFGLDMHGQIVSFASLSEKAAGMRPGCKVPLFTEAQLLAALASHQQHQPAAEGALSPQQFEALMNLAEDYGVFMPVEAGETEEDIRINYEDDLRRVLEQAASESASVKEPKP